jgi:hypothetical protein
MKPGNTPVTPTPAGEVLPEAEREAAEAELRGRVERRPGRRDLPREGRDDHDVPAPALDHAGREAVREGHGRAEVHVERAIDLLGRELEERPARGERRVGDEHVDVARLLREPLDVGARREIGDDDVGPDLAGDPGERVRAPAAQHELHAPLVERAGDGLSDAAVRARDERPAGGVEDHAARRIVEVRQGEVPRARAGRRRRCEYDGRRVVMNDRRVSTMAAGRS